MEPKELNELIKNRRSYFPVIYTGEEVDDSIIDQMLENANWAPNHKHTAPWRFTVFTGEGLNKLASFQAELYKKLSGDKFDEGKYQKLSTKPQMCSHVISLGLEFSGEVPKEEEMEALGCAVQNMYLTTEAYGIGGYWGSGGITYKPEANEFFGLSENGMLMGFFFVGVPKIRGVQGRRKPIQDKVNWVR